MKIDLLRAAYLSAEAHLDQVFLCRFEGSQESRDTDGPHAGRCEQLVERRNP